MGVIIDAKGFSCPQPVLMAITEMRKLKNGEIVILVDTDTSKENVSRAAASEGWTVKSIEEDGVGYRIRITKD